MSEETPGHFIETQEELKNLAAKLRHQRRLGIDTEFVGERTYVPQLELVQVSGSDLTAVIDCRAVSSLEPLLDVLHDRRIEKVFHAGQQDLELMFSLSGRVP